MGNYPHAGSMATSKRKDIRSSRGNLELQGLVYPVEDKIKDRQPTKLQRKVRRQSCPGQVSAFEHRASNASSSTHLRTGSTSQTHRPISFSPNPPPGRLYSSPKPSSSSSSPLRHSVMEPTRSISPASSTATATTTPTPPSAVLLRDLVRDRATPSPSFARPLSVSPSISPAHSRNASLANLMPPIQEDWARKRRESTCNVALDGPPRRASHLSSFGDPLLPGGAASCASLVSSGSWGPPGQGRRATYYQYGEDYITRYDRVGMMASPAPSGYRSPSPGSTRTSLMYSINNNNNNNNVVDGVQQFGSPNPSQSQLGIRQGNRSTTWEGGNSIHTTTTGGGGGWAHVLGDHDVEKAESERSASGASSDLMSEKMMMRKRGRNANDKGDRWVSWPRLLAFVLTVLALAGIAVGIGFGMRR